VHAARPSRPGRHGVPGADGHARHHANGSRGLSRRPGLGCTDLELDILVGDDGPGPCRSGSA
jgi:hypothetical protein